MSVKSDTLAVTAKLVDELIEHGFTITVDDGEDTPIKNSTDAKAIKAALWSVDEEHLIVEKDGRKGWVYLVYGNDGWDVINDYNTWLEPYLTETNALAERLSE